MGNTVSRLFLNYRHCSSSRMCMLKHGNPYIEGRSSSNFA